MANLIAHYFHLRRTTRMAPADCWGFAEAMDQLDAHQALVPRA